MITEEQFSRTVKALIKMIITARKEAAIANALAIRASADLTATTLAEVRQQIGQAYDDVARRLDHLPPDDALELLRAFEGPVQ